MEGHYNNYVAATPIKADLKESDLAELQDCFTGMKINNNSNNSSSSDGEFFNQKRSADRMTIEGSPVNLPDNHHNIKCNGNDDDDDDDVGCNLHQLAKRIDLNPTPVRKASFDLTASTGSTSTSSIFSSSVTHTHHSLLVISSGSDDHDTGDHQENSLRTALLSGPNGCLRRLEVNKYIKWIDDEDIQLAPISDILRVHEYNYIKHLQDKCYGTSPSLPSFYAPAGKLDSDTPLVPQSLNASRKFCGAAMVAVDNVMQGTYTRAFVLGRPPGHHAGSSGCVPSDFFWKRPDMTSSGFCLLNTVAVAAAYARYQYGRRTSSSTCKNGKSLKVAIVDIDVHHGNGTEEIVRNLTPRTVFMPLPSSWAPVSMPIYKPWLNDEDANEVFFGSINLYAGERFYPCSGDDTATCGNSSSSSDSNNNNNNNNNIVNVALTPVGPGPWDSKAKHNLPQVKKVEYCNQASRELRDKVSKDLIPKLKQFQPDLLIISAGFDAHFDDYYHFLTEADYHWLTDVLCSTTTETGGKVISVLEGGYSLSSPVKAGSSSSASSSNDGVGRAGRGKNKKYDDISKSTDANNKVPSFTASNDPSLMFAQQPGDGGLVKGVLSHAASLIGIDKFIQ